MSDDGDVPRDEAQPEDAVVALEPTEDADDGFHPFDEVAEELKLEAPRYVKAADGVWTAVDETTESDTPPLSTSTLICMGDYSSFVIRSKWGEILVQLDAAAVERAPNGRWRARHKAVLDAAKDALAAKEAAWRSTSGWVEVEPIRPPCRHYVRQKTQFHLSAQHRLYARLCSARRTTEGTFMTVRDTAMWACDMRDPYDAASARELDAFDELKIREGRERVHTPLGGGIFDGPSGPEHT